MAQKKSIKTDEPAVAGPPEPEQADFLIIGGGVAGFTAAQTLRNEGAGGSIVLLAAEKEYPYKRPPLTKAFIKGTIAHEHMLLAKPERYAQDKIDIRLGREACSLDLDAHVVRDQTGASYRYGKLLIASGGHACRLDLPGAGLEGVFTFRSMDDAQALREWVLNNPGRITIVGTSFIAMELATALTQMGQKITLLDRAESVFPRIHSTTLSEYFLERSEAYGIDVILGENIRAIRGRAAVSGIETEKGRKVACKTVIMAVGSLPETAFLEDSGLHLGEGVLVNEFLQTSHEDVYAAGDVASYPAARGKRQRSMHWENSRRQGQIAAKNILGQRIPYTSVLHYYSNFLDFSFTFLGTSENADRLIARGSLGSKSYAEFYMRGGRIIGMFSTGRPPEETQIAENLIRDRVVVRHAEKQLADPTTPISDLARETILILQGGAALGAFECGVVRALDEARIEPSVVGGVSIGAINGVIIAGNPGHAAEAVESFWNEIDIQFHLPVPDSVSTALAVGTSMMWGVQDFFRPRWLTTGMPGGWDPKSWTSFYDLRPLRNLLQRYVDFEKLPNSPIRLIVSAVEVDRGELVYFDSRLDTLTPDHILASCSLPPIFPWTTIDGKHYWDGGIVSNSPLEHVLKQVGADNKRVFIVDLFPGERPLPTNLAEVMSRRDEIIYGERIRNDAHVRELVEDFKSLVDETMAFVDPDIALRLQQAPGYVRLMGRGATTSITRIVRDGSGKEPLAAHYDFSAQAIDRQRKEGYLTAVRLLSGGGAPAV